MITRRTDDDLSWEEIRRVFDYDPVAGVITWKCPAKYSPAKMGDVAGAMDRNGYIRITYKFKRYKAHRVAWKWVHGVWPVAEIDHEDTNRSNNALCNLRPATSSQNKGNVGLTVRNTSGYKGVSWHAKAGKWQVSISTGGKVQSLGKFDDPQEAAEVYRAAAVARFGEFARAA